MNLIRLALCALAVFALPALAQYPMELISLRHRTVEQVLPALQPLLEPGGQISGQAGTLIVRTSPSNLRELLRVLETVDRPARRLQIAVRIEDAADAGSQGIAASGRIGERGARVDIGARDSRSVSQERVDQRLQVLEGSRAFIATGQTRTLPQRQVIQTPGGVVSQQTYTVQELATGFEVVPRLAGSLVHLDISQQRESPGAHPGAVQGQRIATTVSAPLGEWVELGATSSASSQDERGIASAGRAAATQARRVFVKVEAVN